MQLGGATPAREDARRHRPVRARAGSGSRALVHENAGLRHADDPMARQPDTHAQVEPRVDRRQSRVETLDSVEHAAPHQQPALAHREYVA